MSVLTASIVIDLYKKHPDVPTPHYGTTLAACFDLTYFPTEPFVRGYDIYNNPVEREVLLADNDAVCIYPGDRLLLPTGLIMRIPRPMPNWSIRLHPRSGLSLKRGLVLANSEGVIDVDYQQEIFALMTNISEKMEIVKRGERLCQGEVVMNLIAAFNVIDAPPEQNSERDGGFGSTGV